MADQDSTSLTTGQLGVREQRLLVAGFVIACVALSAMRIGWWRAVMLQLAMVYIVHGVRHVMRRRRARREDANG